MSTKKSKRAGGKFGGTHTTFSEPAAKIADIASRQEEVTNISAGHLTSGTKTKSGPPRVKIADFEGGVLLSVRATISIQEVRIFTRDEQRTKLAIACGARDLGYDICFPKKQKNGAS